MQIIKPRKVPTGFSGKVPKIGTHAVSVHNAISRERGGHQYLKLYF
ncbi:MAG: hypothetical protein ACYCSW_04260 [bacterium]